MNYERKEVALEDLELKVEGDTAGTFSGYASTFGKVDLQNEIVEAGAFARSLTKSGGQYPLLWQHNHDEPIGSITAQENSRGLFVRGKLVLGVSKAKDAYELLKEKLLTGMSIGFRVIKDGWRDRVRHLKE